MLPIYSTEKKLVNTCVGGGCLSAERAMLQFPNEYGKQSLSVCSRIFDARVSSSRVEYGQIRRYSEPFCQCEQIAK